MGEARSLSHQHFYIRSVGYGEIIANSSKSDTEVIPIRCLLLIPSLLVGNDTDFIGAVERDCDEQGQA
jgi:hypothetical protein